MKCENTTHFMCCIVVLLLSSFCIFASKKRKHRLTLSYLCFHHFALLWRKSENTTWRKSATIGKSALLSHCSGPHPSHHIVPSKRLLRLYKSLHRMAKFWRTPRQKIRSRKHQKNFQRSTFWRSVLQNLAILHVVYLPASVAEAHFLAFFKNELSNLTF